MFGTSTNNMEPLEILFGQLREASMASLKALPIGVDIEPTTVVINLNTDRDGIDLYGGIKVVRVEPGCVIIDKNGTRFSLDDTDIHAVEDIEKLRRAIVAGALKKIEQIESETPKENEGLDKKE